MKLNDIIPILPHNCWTHLAYEMFINEHLDQFIINEHQYLIEGILLSHPRNLVVKKLLDQFHRSIYIYPMTVDVNNILIHITADTSIQINSLVQFIQSMGWYISGIQLGTHNIEIQQGIDIIQKKEYDQAIITIEASKPTTDSKEVGDTKGISVDIPKWLYHVTPTQLWRDKISKIGLAPKTKSVRADHPARVYVTTSSALAIALIPDLAKQRLNQAKASTYDPSKYNPVKYYKDWSVLQIDTTKVPGVRGLSYLTLYKDPNIPNIKGAGFFTLNYIPPDAITMIKRIKL